VALSAIIGGDLAHVHWPSGDEVVDRNPAYGAVLCREHLRAAPEQPESKDEL